MRKIKRDRKLRKLYNEKHNVYSRKHYKKWCEKIKENMKKYLRKKRLEVRKKVLEHYGNKCQCCGETIPEFLTIDHINNDGYIQRKKQWLTYARIIKKGFPLDLQILCWNCNMAKAHYRQCPHKKNKKYKKSAI